MSAALEAVTPIGAAAIVYDIDEQSIAEAAERCATMSCDTAEGYEETRVAIGKLRSTRTAIEKRRKDLKAGALAYERAVDARAKHLTGLVESIEEPLQAKKDAADAAKAEAKRQAEEAALIARDAELRAAREADEARLSAERLVFEEAKRKADVERAATDAAQAAERAKLDAERAELDAKKKAIDNAARAAEEAENRRLAGIQAEKDLAARAERDRVEAERRAAAAVAEATRLEAMKPDIERLFAWAGTVRTFANDSAPDLDSPDVAAAVAWSRGQIVKVADALLKFQPIKKV